MVNKMNIFKSLFRKVSRGFTIAEVVVSMAVIAIVTVTSITCIEKCRLISSQSIYYAEARDLANNTLEIFKFSCDQNEFSNNLRYLEKRPLRNQNVYNYSNNLYSIEITINYSDTDTGFDTFKAVCFKSNGKQLFKVEYQKR